MISIDHLTLGYENSGKVLFKDLNLKINPFELICLMGPNGVGKSTFIRTLAGLHSPFSGSISFAGKQQQKSEQISIVLTDRPSVGSMLVYELVSYGRYPYLGWDVRLSKEDKNLVDAAIQRVKIEHLVNHKISSLSDGQLQMVMIARALAQDTPVMLLDEPTAHLDLNNRLEIMKLLRDIAHTHGKGIVVSTHDLDLALQTADTIWLAGGDGSMTTGLSEDLVLNGVFDSVFQFKGFDLKTGKVQHAPFRNKRINLRGEGHALLWTKNALERNGYEISSDGQATIDVMHHPTEYQWRLTSDNISQSFPSLSALLSFLRNNL